jgi:hypothetical protein
MIVYGAEGRHSTIFRKEEKPNYLRHGATTFILNQSIEITVIMANNGGRQAGGGGNGQMNEHVEFTVKVSG